MIYSTHRHRVEKITI